MIAATTLLTPVPSSARPLGIDKDYNEVLNGVRLHFHVSGRDPDSPYLLVLADGPGEPASVLYAWGATSDIEVWFNIVYLDIRGTGGSARLTTAAPSGPSEADVRTYTFPTLIADIEAVRRRLKLPQWYVLGHGWGGMLGMEYVAAHPEAVLGFIDMDGPVSEPESQDAFLAFARSYYEDQHASETSAAAAPTGSAATAAAGFSEVARLEKLAPGPERVRGIAALLASDPALADKARYARPKAVDTYRKSEADILKAYKMSPYPPAPEPLDALLANEHLATRDDTPLLSRIAVPTLILVGRKDPFVTAEQAGRIRAAIKGSTMLFIDDAGHSPFIDQPDRTATTLISLVLK